MDRVQSSSAERRAIAWKRDLVLQLFLRQGRFFSAIQRLRDEYDVPVETRLPAHANPASDIDGDTWRLIFPPGWKWPPQRSPHETVPRWMADFGQLRVRFAPPESAHRPPVPFEIRFEGCPGIAEDEWSRFLWDCVAFDPPADCLLEFADGPPASTNVVGDLGRPASTLVPSRRPPMVAPLIEELFHPNDVALEEHRYYRNVIAALHDRLAPFGIDVHRMTDEIEQEMFADYDEWRAEHRRHLTWNTYIRVDPDTAEADVSRAFALIAAGQSGRLRPAKPRRDPLLCLQCAVWYDDCGWSLGAIGGKCGWAIQYPAGQKPRCETARQHIAEGRRIRRQESVAA